MHIRARQPGRKGPRGHIQPFDQLAVPFAERMKRFSVEMAGCSRHPCTGLQLLPAPLAVVLPASDPEVLLPHLPELRAETFLAFGDQRRNRRQLTIDRDSVHRTVIQCPYPQPRQPPPQRRMHRRVRPHATHRPPQSRPRGIPIRVASAGPLNDRQRKALEGKQLARQHTDTSLTLRASGERNRQRLWFHRSVFAQQHRPTFNPAPGENECALGMTLCAGNGLTDTFAFDRRRAKLTIGNGNRGRYLV